VVLDGGDVVGAAVNEAARLQDQAEPDVVLISADTHELVQGFFDVVPRGPTRLRGVSRAIEAFAVTGQRASVRLEAAGQLTPFTARQAELDTLAGCWRDTVEGRPAPAVLVTGGPGLGKSRLIHEAAARIDAPALECRCSGFRQTASLHAFRGLLERACGIAAGDGPEQRLRKLRAAAQADLPLLAGALGIPLELTAPPADVDPSKLRLLALHTAAALVQAQAPALLIVEDLHWADESTLDLLAVLVSQPRAGLLVVLSAREEFAPPWPVTRIALAPLTRAELASLSVGLPDCARLAPDRLDELFARSDGVPLFFEELVRSSDAGDPRGRFPSVREPDPRIPAALRDSLLARLASPGLDLELAQVAATIGRDVDRELLQRVTGLGDELAPKLVNLIAGGIFDRDGEGTVRFRHELIRVVAYETQRRTAAREAHSRIADALATVAPGGDSGERAFHLEKAHRFEEAISGYLAAAQQGQGVGAHKEATADLTHALTLLERLPDGPARLVTEFTARQLRSFSAVAAGGFGAPEAHEDHARCVVLADLLGSGPELLPSLQLGWTYYLSRGDLVNADALRDTIETIIAASGGALIQAEVGRGVSAWFRGDYVDGHRAMETFLADPWGYTPDGPPDGYPLPNDPVAAISAYQTVTLWLLGRPKDALAVADRALRRAAELRFPYGPFSTAMVVSHLAIMKRLEGDYAAALAHAEEVAAIGERHGFALWWLTGTLAAALNRVQLDQPEALEVAVATLAQWRQGLASEVSSPYWLTELAAAQLHAGRRAEALASLDEAVALGARLGVEQWAAEALRLRGTLRWENGDPGGLDDLRHAVEKARRQGATAFQLRASVALEAARSLVSP
jgi:hypothetical protein